MGNPYTIPMIPFNNNYPQRQGRYINGNNNYNKNKKQIQRNNYNNNQNNQNINNNINKNINNNVNVNENNKEDEPSLEYLDSIETIEGKKDYLGEFLFKKIEQHPLAHEKNFTIDIIGRITGMILGIEDIREIYEITTNYQSLTSRINEALHLLENQ